jgi:hypothetical protein
MSNGSPSPPTACCTIELIESHTPAAPRTLQMIATATTSTIPSAIESRNDVFITDHASTCTRRSCARRVRRGADAGFAPSPVAGRGVRAGRRFFSGLGLRADFPVEGEAVEDEAAEETAAGADGPACCPACCPACGEAWGC